MQPITVNGLRLVDGQGRERIFHGVNMKCGNEPLKHLALLDEEFFRRSAGFGLRLLRLGVCWEHLEPERGYFNEHILSLMDNIFGLAAKYGVYVFIDMHQDLWSSFGDGAGNGAPAWACLSDGYRAKPVRFVWGERYFWGKNVHRCFDHFWNNDPVAGVGLQDHFARVWQMLARRYGDHPALFGFDLLNEPFPGSPGGVIFRKLVAKLARVILISPSVKRVKFFKSLIDKEKHGYFLDVLTPEVMEKVTGAAQKLLDQFHNEKYAPFIARMTKAIREVTPNGVILTEHCYYSNLGNPASYPLPSHEKICYSPHGYDFMVDTAAYKYANSGRVGYIFQGARRTQQALGVPVVVGEWGGGGEGESFLPHIEFLMDLYDSYNWSNTYFNYGKDLYDNPIMRILSRPYPWAVNGVIERFSCDTAGKTFTLDYAPAETDLPTEIFLPDGFDSIDAGEGARFACEDTLLKVWTTAGRIVVRYK